MRQNATLYFKCVKMQNGASNSSSKLKTWKQKTVRCSKSYNSSNLVIDSDFLLTNYITIFTPSNVTTRNKQVWNFCFTTTTKNNNRPAYSTSCNLILDVELWQSIEIIFWEWRKLLICWKLESRNIETNLNITRWMCAATNEAHQQNYIERK